MKITYELEKEDVEEMVRFYFRERANTEEPHVTIVSKDLKCRVEIDDMLFEDI